MKWETKQEFCCRQGQTKEQYAFTVFLTCPQQTDQMIWWCGTDFGETHGGGVTLWV